MSTKPESGFGVLLLIMKGIRIGNHQNRTGIRKANHEKIISMESHHIVN